MGEWTAPFPWPMIGVHLNLLPDGNVLTWGDGGDAQIWRPTTGNFTPVPKPVEIFAQHGSDVLCRHRRLGHCVLLP